MKLTIEQIERLKEGLADFGLGRMVYLEARDIDDLCDLALQALRAPETGLDCEGHATQAQMKACPACQAEAALASTPAGNAEGGGEKAEPRVVLTWVCPSCRGSKGEPKEMHRNPDSLHSYFEFCTHPFHAHKGEGE